MMNQTFNIVEGIFQLWEGKMPFLAECLFCPDISVALYY